MEDDGSAPHMTDVDLAQLQEKDSQNTRVEISKIRAQISGEAKESEQIKGGLSENELDQDLVEEMSVELQRMEAREDFSSKNLTEQTAIRQWLDRSLESIGVESERLVQEFVKGNVNQDAMEAALLLFIKQIPNPSGVNPDFSSETFRKMTSHLETSINKRRVFVGGMSSAVVEKPTGRTSQETADDVLETQQALNGGEVRFVYENGVLETRLGWGPKEIMFKLGEMVDVLGQDALESMTDFEDFLSKNLPEQNKVRQWLGDSLNAIRTEKDRLGDELYSDQKTRDEVETSLLLFIMQIPNPSGVNPDFSDKVFRGIKSKLESHIARRRENVIFNATIRRLGEIDKKSGLTQEQKNLDEEIRMFEKKFGRDLLSVLRDVGHAVAGDVAFHTLDGKRRPNQFLTFNKKARKNWDDSMSQKRGELTAWFKESKVQIEGEIYRLKKEFVEGGLTAENAEIALMEFVLQIESPSNVDPEFNERVFEDLRESLKSRL